MVRWVFGPDGVTQSIGASGKILRGASGVPFRLPRSTVIFEAAVPAIFESRRTGAVWRKTGAATLPRGRFVVGVGGPSCPAVLAAGSKGFGRPPRLRPFDADRAFRLRGELGRTGWSVRRQAYRWEHLASESYPGLRGLIVGPAFGPICRSMFPGKGTRDPLFPVSCDMSGGHACCLAGSWRRVGNGRMRGCRNRSKGSLGSFGSDVLVAAASWSRQVRTQREGSKKRTPRRFFVRESATAHEASGCALFLGTAQRVFGPLHPAPRSLPTRFAGFD